MTHSRPRLYPSETFDFMFLHVVEELRKSGHPYRVKAIAPDIHGVYGARFEFSDFNIVILSPATDFSHIEQGRNEGANLLRQVLARVRSLQKVDAEQKREHVTYQFALSEAWGFRRHYTRLQIQGDTPRLFDPQQYMQRSVYQYSYADESNKVLKEKKFEDIQPASLGWQGFMDHNNCGRFVGYSAGQPVRDALQLTAQEMPDPEQLEKKFKWVENFRDCCSDLPEYACIARHPNIKKVRNNTGIELTAKMKEARDSVSLAEFKNIELDEEKDTQFEDWHYFPDKQQYLLKAGKQKEISGEGQKEVKAVENKNDQQQKQLLQQQEVQAREQAEQARLAEAAAAERRRVEEQARVAEAAATERRRAEEKTQLQERCMQEQARRAQEERLNQLQREQQKEERAAIFNQQRVEQHRHNVSLGAILTALTIVTLVLLFPQYFIVKGLMSIISALTYCAPVTAKVGVGVVALVGGGLLGGVGVEVSNVFFGSCCRDDSSSNGIRRSSSQASVMREVGSFSHRSQPSPRSSDHKNDPQQNPFSRREARGEGGQRPDEVGEVARARPRSP